MFIYKVKEGDTLKNLEEKFKINQINIITDNNLKVPYTLLIGLCLIIDTNKIDYIVKGGDTLSKLSNEYSLSIETIKRQNNISSLQKGQKLTFRYQNKNKYNCYINGYCYQNLSDSALAKYDSFLSTISPFAYKIKEDIKRMYGFTVNVGIGNNKLCAKMASDFEKPDKVHTLYMNEIEEKMWPLPVNDLFMIGAKTTEVLNRLNIKTIEDLAKANKKELEKHFKSMAEHMILSANGIDNSEVTPRKSKNQSISTTETLQHDTTDEAKLKEVLFRQTQDVAHQLRNQNQYAKTVAIIYKDSNFISYSQQEKLSRETNNTKDIYSKVIELFEKSYKKEPIRLIGVRLSDLTTTRKVQISLFEEESVQDEEDSFQKTLDAINNKFGKDLVAPASLKAIAKNTKK